jgi:hypothetical protein
MVRISPFPARCCEIACLSNVMLWRSSAKAQDAGFNVGAKLIDSDANCLPIGLSADTKSSQLPLPTVSRTFLGHSPCSLPTAKQTQCLVTLMVVDHCNSDDDGNLEVVR